MAQPPTRSQVVMIFRSFVNFIRSRQITEDFVGNDYFGNKYYEIAANSSMGKRRANRWFEPLEKEDFSPEMPAEWEAWLRGRRKEPPAEEEVMKNLALVELNERNAIELEKKAGRNMESFPHRPEYERMPGKPRS